MGLVNDAGDACSLDCGEVANAVTMVEVDDEGMWRHGNPNGFVDEILGLAGQSGLAARRNPGIISPRNLDWSE
jgi:hypothetical protein